MVYFKTGDLVAKIHHSVDKPIQIGLVISDNSDKFSVKWTSYNKFFFMEKEEDIFEELNKTFLLSTVSFKRGTGTQNLSLLSSIYSDGYYTP